MSVHANESVVMPKVINSIMWEANKIRLLDQTQLPTLENYLDITEVDQLIDSIVKLKVRGAPALGVAGAYGVVIILDEAMRKSWTASEVDSAIDRLRDARPTAVNLAWGVNKVRALIPTGRNSVLEAAHQIMHKDKESNLQMAARGADAILALVDKPQLTLLTHCNTGSLATTGVGTALGVIRELNNRGRVQEVFADETRPLLQGARLTAWELEVSGINYRLLPDSAAAMAITRGYVDVALVGADRIAKNGDSANKIGTLGVALACKAAGIPFFVVAPESTVDRSMESGELIHIEFRADDEVTNFAGTRTAPLGAHTFNPAFDVTPAGLITGVVTEDRVYKVSLGESL